MLLLAQHRVMGATLLVAVVGKALRELQSERTRGFEFGWLFALLLFGVELLLYTEEAATSGHASPEVTP